MTQVLNTNDRRSRMFELMRQEGVAETVAERINKITLNASLTESEIALLRCTVISSLYPRQLSPR
ncbi:MAG: hypothetical protein HRU30_15225 [Rhodobacteraceae bacterium]|nr:hypothetical protein [Paracoccaceae bacterium]